MSDLLEDLRLLVRTRHSLITIQTVEEEFAARLIREVARDMGVPGFEWSISSGLTRSVPAGDAIGGTENFAACLRYMRRADGAAIYILKDAVRYLADAAAERLVREIAMDYARDNRTIFLLDTAVKLPDSLSTMAVPYDLALPTREEIEPLVKETIRRLTLYGRPDVRMTRAQFEQFLDHLRGLTRNEVQQVVADALLANGCLTSEDVSRPVQTKRQRLRQTGVLDYIPPPEASPSVGGMANLQRWLSLRQKAYTPEAREYGLEEPKGVLMLGVQGCGKSLMARYVAAQWKMPLLRMDVGALYEKYVGQTERHMRDALKLACAMSPCVLWIDEIEKAFASAGAGAEGAVSDGGLSQRVFGMLLTWMQERREPVFIVATANDVSALPPELMRKGRFDEVFFVDLPGEPSRRMIFEIHLTRRKRNPATFDLAALAAASDGFSGAEIEQAIVAAMYCAFGESRDVTTADLLAELRNTRPLSVVMGEKVASLRAWAADRCVRAD